MKQAIITKYLPNTATKPARIRTKSYRRKAYDWSLTHTVTASDAIETHHTFAKAYSVKNGGTDKLIGAGMPDGNGYAFVPCDEIEPGVFVAVAPPTIGRASESPMLDGE